MSNGFQVFTYTKHAETRLAQRGISKAQVETALNDATVIYPSRGAFVAEVRIPGKDRLALKVVFSRPAPYKANLISIYPIAIKRTRL